MATATTQAWRAVLHGGGGVAEEAAAADRELRASVGTSRRITFLSATGGCGTTTVASGVALALSNRRSGHVLALDVGGGPSGVGVRLGAAGAPRLAEIHDREAVQTLAEAQQRLRPVRARLWVAGGSPAPALESAVSGALASVGRFFEVAVTDAGRRPVSDAVGLASGSHVTAVVARADAGSSAAGRAIVDAVRETGGRAVLVLVSVNPRTGRSLGEPGSLRVPYDEEAARSLGTRLPRLGPATRAALVSVAARLVTEARAA